MSVLMSASVSAEDFLFQELLANYPSGTIQLEPSVPISTEMIPYVWVTDIAPDRLEDLLLSELGVESVEIVDTTNSRTLVRLTWCDDDVGGLMASFRTTPVAMWEAVGTGDRWYFSLRFLTPDAVSRFYRECQNKGVTVNPIRIQQDKSGMAEGADKYGLTPVQRQTLVEAFELGYFAIPRKITLVELAEMHAVSDNAISERLRRGIGSLIDSTLVDSKELVWLSNKLKRRPENDRFESRLGYAGSRYRSEDT